MSGISTLESPCLLVPYKPESGGVDFLGLRQVNLDLMAACLPGINNVTNYIRPFSLIAWSHWKLYEVAKRQGYTAVPPERAQAFLEKAETLFTWGHVLEGIGGIPGVQAKPPAADSRGQRSLRFADWSRDPKSTSVMAAVQYGPSSKAPDGLGFIEPAESSGFRTRSHGVALAEALDARVKRCGITALETLDDSKGTEADARALIDAWRVDRPSKAERTAFRAAFVDAGRIGDDNTGIGRRTATVTLVTDVLAAATEALSEDQIRQAMVTLEVHGEKVVLREELRRVWARWTTLQLRQLQRLAFEVLLTWIEQHLFDGTARVVGDMLDLVLSDAPAGAIWNQSRSPSDAVQSIHRRIPSVARILAQPGRNDVGLFGLRDGLYECLDGEEINQAALLDRAVRALLFSAVVARVLSESDATCGTEVRRGRGDRISLSFWSDVVEQLRSTTWKEFLSVVLETYVLSQHFAVAAGRFDGGTQRLRITVEERGLELFAPEVFGPVVSRDRLATALSLMVECEMIDGDGAANAYGLR
jgi:hypothetical protein